MTELVSFSSIDDFSTIARSYSNLLSRADNQDIGLDFPGTLRRYSGYVEGVQEELEKTANSCETGRREQFVVFDEGEVVGLSAVQRVKTPPADLPTDITNVSEFILQPFRGRGLGEATLRSCLQVVDENFEGYAYTEVRNNNAPSIKMVEKVGFVAIAGDEKFVWYVYVQ